MSTLLSDRVSGLSGPTADLDCMMIPNSYADSRTTHGSHADGVEQPSRGRNVAGRPTALISWAVIGAWEPESDGGDHVRGALWARAFGSKAIRTYLNHSKPYPRRCHRTLERLGKRLTESTLVMVWVSSWVVVRGCKRISLSSGAHSRQLSARWLHLLHAMPPTSGLLPPTVTPASLHPHVYVGPAVGLSSTH